MPDPEGKARKQKDALLARERRVLKDIATEYGKAWTAIKIQLDMLGEEIRAAKAAGKPADAAWLLQNRRLEYAERTAQSEVSAFVQFAERRISAAQIESAFAGQDDAAALIGESVGGGFTPLASRGAIDDLVGRTRQGRYLGDILAGLPADAADRVKTGLMRGVMGGKNPRVIAREIRSALAGNQARALMIARTEMLGAYRDAALETYRANSDVVTGWKWLATSGACSYCAGKNGEIAATKTAFHTHPNCRCTPIPVTKSWDEILGQPLNLAA